MNFVYPATDQFYNDNFMIYYCIEFVFLILWCHSTMNFDVLFLSMNITFKYQLKTIANSFSTFNIAHYIKICYSHNHTKNVKHRKESELMLDFKSIIYDQQRVIENMRNIYQIFQPVVLTQLAIESIVIILQSCIIMMNYFNGISLISAMNLRLFAAIMTVTLQIYIICYVFDDVNQQKDSINFALYSSDWTQSHAQHKNLLLHAMRMNNAENLRLQVTRKKICFLLSVLRNIILRHYIFCIKLLFTHHAKSVFNTISAGKDVCKENAYFAFFSSNNFQALII
ncbi:Odorant receptor [Aphis craccivora]|uniref:Odorant receptor n=1 Tax=Aphis craccivora TaxID=307492 RepID=A0A6G0YMW3_APHCR|nr:Odorant receptor [Aphis craccivora]